jgi:two-component system sensor histidine kinase YesM
VENAIVHGLERKQGKGNIDVDILKEGGLLKIIIQDDGMGMDDEELNKVITALDKVDDMPGYRIGLRNVHQRIRLFYGDGYGIKIYSKSGNGTRVEIILPGNEVIPC